uniref:RNA-directed RNA polymerase L n=1 Tax=Merida virus TaxID=1803034 RepID=A0A894KD29_9RHAB|nr:MAG: RNA-dependent RNA polymerase [Merida virus]
MEDFDFCDLLDCQDEAAYADGEDELRGEFDEDGDKMYSDPGSVPGHLVDHDYTLDRPLIGEELDAFVSHMKGHLYNRHFSNGSWKFRESWLRDQGAKIEDLTGSATFHRWLVRLIRSPRPTGDIDKVLSEVDEGAKESFPIVSGFLKKWCDLKTSFKKRSDMKASTKQMGSIYLTFHQIVLMMNSSTESEGEGLGKTFGLKFDWRDGNPAFVGELSDLGKVFICNGVLIFDRSGQSLDRDMTLMVKDLAGGRFQTLIHSEFKEAPAYPTSHYKNILSLFEAGDELLKDLGSSAYSIIKLLEPVALEKMHVLASAARPLIPDFTQFGDHLKKEKLSAIQKSPKASNFFRLIEQSVDINFLLTAFGSFRLWGHPFIDYLEGLKKLHENTTMGKQIDKAYAEALASDLAYKVLHDEFLKSRRWHVDGRLLPKDHPLKAYVDKNQWPSSGLIQSLGDIWHLLPLTPCFTVPDMFDPSIIYADKFHSPTRSEIIRQLTKGVGNIKSKSVLESFIQKPATNWKEFLERINREGLDLEHLAIALSAKEREIKDIGRFFALMTWELREYFVVTEYLIKLFYVPLFKGLTMADDLNTVTMKMLKASDGQSARDYKTITIANHIDYSKWNNHQRPEANNPVFKVMGQFLGLPNLFTRTHEFFSKAFIYYKNRSDLIGTDGTKLFNKPGPLVCWEGQPGGLEGLRQKGWSITNYLCIERQAKIRSTSLRALAQGDNQVLATRYTIRPHRSEQELVEHIQSAVYNNKAILDSVRAGTAKLGLIINENETLQSASLMVYGKVIMYRGLFTCLSEKRYSRVLCTTNDQLPNLSSVIGTIGTNCLTVCHYSDTPFDAILQYNWLGNFGRVMIEMHNPAIKRPMGDIIKSWTEEERRSYRLYFLLLDPALGGVGGMSLTRFLIRQFPDPITESLTFWSLVRELEISGEITTLAVKAGNPRMGKYRSSHFKKLIENPTGLNLPRGISSLTVLRTKIRHGLLANVEKIGNEVVKNSLRRVKADNGRFLSFLESIKPCFPRFVSEFYSSTFMGIVEGTISLFENSKSIRKNLKSKLGSEFDEIVVRSEFSSISGLKQGGNDRRSRLEWKCSSTKADDLRRMSWGGRVIGATVPHPLELLSCGKLQNLNCAECSAPGYQADYVAAVCPQEPFWRGPERGPYDPYLGSKTAETTSLIQPWEKETNIPLIRRAVALRKVISWFVERDSNLARILCDNVKALTGEDLGGLARGYKRTGSYNHRFYCARQSNGGFSGVSPNWAGWFIITTNTLSHIGRDNFDFMFQSLIIFSQVTAVARQSHLKSGGTHHFHIKCLDCLRPVEEPTLDTVVEYTFPDMSVELAKWKPAEVPWFTIKPVIELQEGDWSALDFRVQSFHLGRILGFYYTDTRGQRGREVDDLFPIVLGKYVDPDGFIDGIVDGIFRASSLSLSHRKTATMGQNHAEALTSNFFSNASSLSRDGGFITLMTEPDMYQPIRRAPQRISPAYPSSRMDLSESISAILFQRYRSNIQASRKYCPMSADLWIFADFISVSVAGTFILADRACTVFFKNKLVKADKDQLAVISGIDSIVRSADTSQEYLDILMQSVKVYCTPNEGREAARQIRRIRAMSEMDVEEEPGEFNLQIPMWTRSTPVAYSVTPTVFSNVGVPDIRSPVISGLRLAQLATGSFYKIEAILDNAGLVYQDFISGGDGSGGCTATLLRRSISSRAIFNSLMAGENLSFRGSSPAPPSALVQMPAWIKSRCVNLENCWQKASDLRRPETWKQFQKTVSEHLMKVGLIFLDMELIGQTDEDEILDCLLRYGLSILRPHGKILYKTYAGQLLGSANNVLTKIGSCFHRVSLYQTSMTGSHSSEVYVLMEGQVVNRSSIQYPDLSSCKDWLLDSFCFRTVDEERERALRLFNWESVEGIPRRFFPDLELEFHNLLRTSGIDPATVPIIAQNIYYSSPHQLPSILIGAILGGTESVFPTARFRRVSGLIPSDQKILKWSAMVFGVAYWLSLAMDEPYLYRKTHVVNQQGISFSYLVEYSDDQHTHGALKWSLSRNLGRTKTVRLDSQQAQQSRWIRALTRLCVSRHLDSDIDLIKSVARSIAPNVKVSTILARSGTLDVFTDEILLPPGKWGTGYEDEVDLMREPDEDSL